ncbi:MAG: putative toxin-antitoxin system toxin component, PIN family [Gammaproteobacteria bacterium]
MARILVVDTNVFVSALLGKGAANRVVAECVAGEREPLMGAALLAEYEAILGRTALWARSRLIESEREEVLDAFLARCRWVRIFFAWRPNLRDEADNHIVELAVAGAADAIVTSNVRDFRVASELRFPELAVLTPAQLLRRGK